MGERVATLIIERPRWQMLSDIGLCRVGLRSSTESAILPTQSQQHHAGSGPAALVDADRLRPCGFSLGVCGKREGTGPNLTSQAGFRVPLRWPICSLVSRP